MSTKIEWCDETLNPVVGCSKCSPGCDNCYAERFAARMAKHPNQKIRDKYAGVVDDAGKWTGEVSIPYQFPFSELRNTKKPKRIFVGSMTDIFHRKIAFDFLRMLWSGMSYWRHNTYCILTKRPERMYAFCEDNANPPLPNVWLGVTVCNQAEADEKIPILLQTPAAKRFVSIEPMLGPVDLTRFLTSEERAYRGDNTSGFLDYEPLLHWVICGGETGPGARPIHPAWVRGLRNQCVGSGVPFFFKHWGEWHSWGEKLADGNENFLAFEKVESRYRQHEGVLVSRVGKKRAGRLLDGREWNEAPA